MRGLLLLAPLFFVAVACSATPVDAEGDVGAESLGSTDAKVSAACTLTRKQIMASTTAQRGTAITRGFAWWDAKVPYSQSASHAGYRTDCSGFVSMAWQLQQPGFTTGDFATGGASNKILSSYDDLAPGDGFVRRVGGEGHAILFLGWNDAAHTQACTLEEADTALDMQFGIHAVASLKAQSFKPMRNNAFTSTTPSGNTGDDDDDSTAAGDDDDDDDSTVTSSPLPPVGKHPGSGNAGTSGGTSSAGTSAGGASCANDGMCNPGNDGSGLICSGGQCVPGCHSDAHCPGNSTCVSGQCQ